MSSLGNLHIHDMTTDASVIDTTEGFGGLPRSLSVQQRKPGDEGDADNDSDDENDDENDDEDDETVDDDDVTLATVHPGQ